MIFDYLWNVAVFELIWARHHVNYDVMSVMSSRAKWASNRFSELFSIGSTFVSVNKMYSLHSWVSNELFILTLLYLVTGDSYWIKFPDLCNQMTFLTWFKISYCLLILFFVYNYYWKGNILLWYRNKYFVEVTIILHYIMYRVHIFINKAECIFNSSRIWYFKWFLREIWPHCQVTSGPFVHSPDLLIK